VVPGLGCSFLVITVVAIVAVVVLVLVRLAPSQPFSPVSHECLCGHAAALAAVAVIPGNLRRWARWEGWVHEDTNARMRYLSYAEAQNPGDSAFRSIQNERFGPWTFLVLGQRLTVVCLCACVREHACESAFVYACVHLRMCACVCVCVCVRALVSMCVCVCVCVGESLCVGGYACLHALLRACM
jgi:hypothetical protein